MRRADMRPAPDRVAVPRDAFLRTTGQIWKLVLGGVVLPVVGAAVGGRDLLQTDRASTVGFAATVVALILVLAAVAVVLGSVRCPRCRARLMADATRDPEGLGALTRLLQRRTCPTCGYAPNLPEPSA